MSESNFVLILHDAKIKGGIQPVAAAQCNVQECTDECQREFGPDGQGQCEGESPAQICYCIHPCWVLMWDNYVSSILFTYFYHKISIAKVITAINKL